MNIPVTAGLVASEPSHGQGSDKGSLYLGPSSEINSSKWELIRSPHLCPTTLITIIFVLSLKLHLGACVGAAPGLAPICGYLSLGLIYL